MGPCSGSGSRTGGCRQRCAALLVACRSPRHVADSCKMCAARSKNSRRAMRLCCTKTYLIALNLMFLLCGGAALGIGFWMRFDRESYIYVELFHAIPSSGPVVLLDRMPSVFVLVGGSVAILSFLGCCGACADSACFLCIYALLLCLVLITEIIIVVVIIVFRQQVLRQLESSLLHQIQYEYNKTGRPINFSAPSDEADPVAAVMDVMQLKFNCCGATGPIDYRHSAWFNRTRHLKVHVPNSCCVPVPVTQPRTPKSAVPLPAPSSPTSFSSSINSGLPLLSFLPFGSGSSDSGKSSRVSASSSSSLPGSGGGQDGDGTVDEYNVCQLEAILIQTEKDLPPSSRDAHNVKETTALKTQGCQRWFNEWYVANTACFIVTASIVVVLQVLDLIAACVLMARVRQKHANCQWSEESDFG